MRGTATTIGGTLLLDRTKYFRGQGRIFEHDGRTKKRRNEKRHELAKHVAERNRGNKPQRMNPALVTAIFVDALLERFEVREEVTVGKHNTARLAGGARSKQDFRHVASRGFDRWLRRRAGCRGTSRRKAVNKRRLAKCKVGLRRVAKNQFHLRIANDALHELGGSRPHPWARQQLRADRIAQKLAIQSDEFAPQRRTRSPELTPCAARRLLKEMACACSSE